MPGLVHIAAGDALTGRDYAIIVLGAGSRGPSSHLLVARLLSPYRARQAVYVLTLSETKARDCCSCQSERGCVFVLPLPGWESVYRTSQNQDGIQEPEDRCEVSVWSEGGWEIEREEE